MRKTLPKTSSNTLSKDDLRAQLFAARGRVSDSLRLSAPEAILASFFDHVEVKSGQIVSGFFPIGSEIDVLPLLAELRARGVVTCLPVTFGRDQAMIFREFTGDEKLVSVGYGCQAPDEGARELVPDIVLMPLLGFDQQGNRLGYGAGYYDRVLASYSHQPRCVGVAFACQEVVALPAEPHDVKMDMLLSETGVKDWTL